MKAFTRENIFHTIFPSSHVHVQDVWITWQLCNIKLSHGIGVVSGGKAGDVGGRKTLNYGVFKCGTVWQSHHITS